MAEKGIRNRIDDGLSNIWTKHSGKIVLSGFFAVSIGAGGCAQLLQNEAEANREEKDKEQEEVAQRITSELEEDGFDASSISTTKTAAKLIIGDCIVDADFSATGGGWNGLDPIEDITGYTVTQKTDDGKVTRITEFENLSDLQAQTDNNPCAYFFVD